MRGEDLLDLSSVAPTVSQLLELERLPARLSSGNFPVAGSLRSARLLAPVDLQAVKASGVTFVTSLLERVIEEQARGDPKRALAIRGRVDELVGGDLSRIKPGSSEAMALKKEN